MNARSAPRSRSRCCRSTSSPPWIQARAEEEHVRPGAAGEAGGLGVEEQDVLPAARRLAPQAEMREQARLGIAVPDDREPEVGESDALLADHEAGANRARGDARRRRDRRQSTVG